MWIYLSLLEYREVESMWTLKLWKMAYVTLFMYIRNEIPLNYRNSRSLCFYGYIMVKSLLVDIYMDMCGVFLVKVTLESWELYSGLTRKVMSMSFTPCAHLVWGIKLRLEASRAILSWIGLVLRVICESHRPKVAISCLVGEPGVSFHSIVYHMIDEKEM